MHQQNPFTLFPCVTAPWPPVWSLIHGSSHALLCHHCLVEPILLAHSLHTNLMECVTLSFRTYEYDKPCCLQLSCDHPPTMQPHRTDHYVKEYRTITMMRLCHRGQTQQLYLYETFDLTSLPSVMHHTDPSPKHVLKAIIHSLESFWW